MLQTVVSEGVTTTKNDLNNKTVKPSEKSDIDRHALTTTTTRRLGLVESSQDSVASLTVTSKLDKDRCVTGQGDKMTFRSRGCGQEEG